MNHLNDGLAAGNITDNKATFTDGSKYYIWTVKTGNDHYFINSKGRDGACFDTRLTYTTGTLDCNIVSTLDSTSIATKATTLDSLFASSDAEVHYIDLGNALRLQLTRAAVGDTTGIAHIVDKSWVNPSPIAFTANTTWTLSTIGSEQVLTVKLTPSQILNREHDESDLVFSVIEGAVRQGYLIPKGTVYLDDRVNFNSTAKEDILAQFKF